MSIQSRAALRAELSKLQAATRGKQHEDPADDPQHERVHQAEHRCNPVEAASIRGTTR
jgi:hypothetical protein